MTSEEYKAGEPRWREANNIDCRMESLKYARRAIADHTGDNLNFSIYVTGQPGLTMNLADLTRPTDRLSATVRDDLLRWIDAEMEVERSKFEAV
jgi:hypothetical protein